MRVGYQKPQVGEDIDEEKCIAATRDDEMSEEPDSLIRNMVEWLPCQGSVVSSKRMESLVERRHGHSQSKSVVSGNHSGQRFWQQDLVRTMKDHTRTYLSLTQSLALFLFRSFWMMDYCLISIRVALEEHHLQKVLIRVTGIHSSLFPSRLTKGIKRWMKLRTVSFSL